MDANQLVALYRADSAVTVTAKDKPDGWAEITLPFSTLTDKFVRVSVLESRQGFFILTDKADLADDEYETTAELEVSGPYLQGKELLAKRRFEGVTEANGSFVYEATAEMLTAGLFELGQFIQLAVNLAYLSI